MMDLSTRQRRPDKAIYRPPLKKYPEEDDDKQPAPKNSAFLHSNIEKNVNSASNNSNDQFGKGGNNHRRRAKTSGNNRTAECSRISQQYPLKKSASTASNCRAEHCGDHREQSRKHLEKKRTFNSSEKFIGGQEGFNSSFVCEKLVQETEEVGVCDKPSQSNLEAVEPSDQTSIKHGGLIHLPKNVCLSHVSEETTSKVFPSNVRQRGNGRPVVVVHPHPKSVQLDNSCRAYTTVPPQHSCAQKINQPYLLEQKKLPKENTFSNYPAADVFQFGPGFKTLESQARTQSGPLPRVNPSQLQGSLQTPLQLTTKPRNPLVAEKILQAFQMDVALTALMIPPGKCAFGLPPLPEEEVSEASDPEKLFLRWWSYVEKLRTSLMAAFEYVILEDLDFCNTVHVEQGMWKSVFYTVLESLRSWLDNPYLTELLTSPADTVEPDKADLPARLVQRIRNVCVQQIIHAGAKRLTELLHRVQAVRRVRLDYVIGDGRPPPETGSRTRRLVYLSAQKLMIFLGDLARYEEFFIGGQNFGKARSWYQKAQLLVPKNGRPYNQLAVLAVYTARHFDAMCYYMRTLAASNPFPTASQSLAALFSEIHQRTVDLTRDRSTTGTSWLGGVGIHKPALTTAAQVSSQVSHIFAHSRCKRVEIWVHPLDRSVTIVQGNRSLTISRSMSEKASSSEAGMKGCRDRRINRPVGLRVGASDEGIEDETYEEEEAQAEAEEYANVSLIELSKLFGLHFMHAHGLLFTKIGMESFPEVASLALQAFSGLLAQCPCPLSADRLCQILLVNMFNVDRAAAFTAQSTAVIVAAAAAAAENGRSKDLSESENISGKGRAHHHHQQRIEADTLRSVHHDHAARFALDTFSLVCRRSAKLFAESLSDSSSEPRLSSDLRVLLPSLRLWTEWMVLHPEHWSPPPNHRDPTLRPCLDDWHLVAELCTKAADWLSRVPTPHRPKVVEITPTTQLVVQLHLQQSQHPDQEGMTNSHIQSRIQTVSTHGDREVNPNEDDEEAGSTVIIEDDTLDGVVAAVPAAKYAHLFEEVVFAGFKPMLHLTPKLYQYSGDFEADKVADFIRVEKLVMFGDFLCGIEPPVLSYNVDTCTYESVVERESGERVNKAKQPAIRTSIDSDDTQLETSTMITTSGNTEDTVIADEDSVGSSDINQLRQQRAALEGHLSEARRLEAWRQQAIRQAAAGGPRGVEIEVRPIYILPDTNCYVDWLEGVSRLAQASSNYTVLVPIVVLNELDTLATQDRGNNFGNSIENAFAQYITSCSQDGAESRTSLIQQRARAAITYLEGEFERRNPRLRALTARGNMLETIAYRNEANRGRQPGQINDDVILTCCRQFCKEAMAQLSAEGHPGPTTSVEVKNRPMRLVREVVLLTSDRNLRLKALSLNIPARPLRSFVEWSCLTPLTAAVSLTAPQDEEQQATNQRILEATVLPSSRWERRGNK